MSEPTVLGYMKEQPKRLAYVFGHRDIFVHPFVDVFKKYDIKKVIFFGSGTSYNVSQIAAYYFKHIVGIAAEAQYPTVFKHYERRSDPLCRDISVRYIRFNSGSHGICKA